MFDEWYELTRGSLTEPKRSTHPMHAWLGQDVSLYRHAATVGASRLASRISWQIPSKLFGQALDMWLLQHAQVLARSNVEFDRR